MGNIIGSGDNYTDTSIDKAFFGYEEGVTESDTILFKTFYLNEKIVDNQEEKLKSLISALEERRKNDPSSLNNVENWTVDNAWNEWLDYKTITQNDRYKSSFWRTYTYDALCRAKRKDILMNESAIEYFIVLNIEALLYIFSSVLEININFEDLKKYIPEHFDSRDSEGLDIFRKNTEHSSHSDFYDEDLNVKDKNGNVVPPFSKALQKDEKVNQRGETNLAFITKQTIRTFFPTMEGGVQILRNTVGVDIYGVMSGRSIIIDKNNKDTLLSKNFDTNIIVQMLPNVLMSVAHRINNPTFNIIASSTPLILQLITNFKERKNPLIFNSDDKEINWVQFGALFIPIVVESLKLLFPKNQFNRLVESQEAPIFNDANRLFGEYRQKIEQQAQQPVPNTYMGVRREIKQPR